MHNLLCVNNNRHMAETSIRAGNIDVYGFLEPQSGFKSDPFLHNHESYIKNSMQNSKTGCVPRSLPEWVS